MRAQYLGFSLATTMMHEGGADSDGQEGWKEMKMESNSMEETVQNVWSCSDLEHDSRRQKCIELASIPMEKWLLQLRTQIRQRCCVSFFHLCEQLSSGRSLKMLWWP